MKNRTTIAIFVIVLVAAVVATLVVVTNQKQHAAHHDQHPIADPTDGEFHVHADFHIVVNDTLIDLSTDEFQTTSAQSLHPDAHLHNNNGDVEHIHAEGLTFAEFLGSLGITLTDSCLTLDNTYCSGEIEEVLLLVNDEVFTRPISQYIPVDGDRILLYYGSYGNPLLQTYLDNVPDDACYYSGTCPERGIAPSEECGLTCEL